MRTCVWAIGTLLDDAREERGGGVGVAQGQRLAGQRESQLQIAGLDLRRGLQLARRAAERLAGLGLPALRGGQPTRQQPAFEQRRPGAALASRASPARRLASAAATAWRRALAGSAAGGAWGGGRVSRTAGPTIRRSYVLALPAKKMRGAKNYA
jgi:hypothetical protein